MQPLRVLVVSQPLAEGVPVHVADLVNELRSEEFRFTVACPRRSTLWSALEHAADVTLVPFDVGRGAGLRDIPALLRLVPLVRRADVVHAHSAKAGLLGRAAARLAGRSRRCVYTPHAWSFWAVGPRASKAVTVVERILARWCATIIAVSGHERDEGLRRKVGRAVQYRVVPNGIDIERFALPRARVPGRVVTVGRLAAQKRPLLAVDAIAAAHRVFEPAHLRMIGGGPLEEEVRLAVDRAGAAGFVSLEGVRDDVPEQLASASALLVTSEYEGCPISVLEALAAGVPVVASPFGGIDEVVEDGRCGRIATSSEADDIAAALVEVLADEAMAGRMSDAAREAARTRFDRRAVAGVVAGIYRELAG